LKVIFEWRNHDLKMLEDFYGTIDNDDNWIFNTNCNYNNTKRMG
jgi:hypothetical protein